MNRSAMLLRARVLTNSLQERALISKRCTCAVLPYLNRSAKGSAASLLDWMAFRIGWKENH